MNNKKILIGMVFAVVVLLCAACGVSGAASRDDLDETTATQSRPSEKTDGESESQLYRAPDFTVYDAHGNEVRLSDYIGKPVVLNFWASWCGPCQREMPGFQSQYQQLGDEVAFLMVNLTDGVSDTVASVSAFLEEKQYTFPAFFDTNADAAAAYGVSSIPVTYLIDAQGNIVAWASRAVDEDALRKGIEMIR